MYGLVNNGGQTFIIDDHGEAMWRKICATAGLADVGFESMLSCDGSVTHGVVGANCEHMEFRPAQVLEVSADSGSATPMIPRSAA